MLGGVGNVVVSPSNGTITVTTTPDIMRTVAKYVQEENRRLSRQIGIVVEIYKVELAEGTDFDFNMDRLFARLSDDFNFTLASAVGAPDTATNLAQSAGSLSVAILNPTSENAPITGLFRALSTLGDTSRVAQFPMTTLNNRPVTRRVGRDTAYVASVEQSTTGDTSSTSITPGVVQDGFALQLTPRLLDDGRVMLQYSLSITDLIEIVEFNSGTSKVQLPETANKVFVQQSLLKSGSTLVIGGYEDEQAQQRAQGVGSPYNFILGGGSNTATMHSLLFMAITPQVLDVPRAEME
jgi:type IVB pilus formation R64 PilN family outer membrane protein